MLKFILGIAMGVLIMCVVSILMLSMSTVASRADRIMEKIWEEKR